MTLPEAISDAALVELALEFYRTPARFPSLRDANQPLPGDPSVLLKLAGGVASESLGLSPAVGSGASLREAAHFFVQQVLLAPGADYYRMHGLAQDAADERIKEHHRLLMRLFHPDRDAVGSDWQDGFASRINQAYGVLRDAAKRRDYDRGLAAGKGAAPGRTAKAGAVLRMRAWSERELSRGTPTTPFGRYLWRHLPQLVLGATAVVAAAAVALVWWSNAPSGAIGGSGGDSGGDWQTVATAPPPAVERAVAPTLADAQRRRAGDRGDRPAPAEAVTESARPAPVVSSPEGHAPQRRSRGESGDGKVSTDASGQALRPTLTPESGPSARAAAPLAADTRRMAEPGPTRIVPVAAPSGAAPAVSETAVDESRQGEGEPTRLIPEFATRYARGDLDTFMELFDENARNETGGYAKIRKDYDELFAATAARQLYVWDMRWSPQINRTWRGEGRFQVRVQRHNETSMRQYNGTIRIEVSAQGERPLIRSLYHVLADGSR